LAQGQSFLHSRNIYSASTSFKGKRITL